MQLPDYFAVHFDDPHFELFDRDMFTLGTRIEIAFRAEGDPVLVTSGEVTAVSVEPGAARPARAGARRARPDPPDGPRRRSRAASRASPTATSPAASPASTAWSPTSTAPARCTSTCCRWPRATTRSCAAAPPASGSTSGSASARSTSRRARAPPGAPPPLRWGAEPAPVRGAVRVRRAAATRSQVRGWDPLAKREIVGRATEGELGTDAPGGRGDARRGPARVRHASSAPPG